jgi:peptidoglycan/xylan/chitin deacetylase (PgdA/CDA1 family)
MYHGLANDCLNSSHIGTRDPVYTISPDVFVRQMTLLDENRRSGTSVREMVNGSHKDQMPVILTFDDGNRSDVTRALPVLLSHGFSATFYVTTAWIGHPGFLDQDGILELHESGMEIGSHGHTHRYFDELSIDELRREIEQSVDVLSSITGQDVAALGLPGGRSHSKMPDVARSAGIQTVGTSKVALFDTAADPYDIPRIAVSSSTSDSEFVKMISGQQRYFVGRSVRQSILDAAKRVLGNNLYEKVRNRLLE